MIRGGTFNSPGSTERPEAADDERIRIFTTQHNSFEFQRLRKTVGARQLVRQDGGAGGPFYGASRCNLPRRTPTGGRLRKTECHSIQSPFRRGRFRRMGLVTLLLQVR